MPKGMEAILGINRILGLSASAYEIKNCAQRPHHMLLYPHKLGCWYKELNSMFVYMQVSDAMCNSPPAFLRCTRALFSIHEKHVQFAVSAK
jgi:hypothetical protein